MKIRAYSILVAIIAFSILFTVSGCSGSASNAPKVETITNQNYKLTMQVWDDTGLKAETIERDGVYTGEAIDGIPNGNGRFDSANPQGAKWYYEGEFTNGTFNGYGICVWPDSDSPKEEGQYVNGLYSPGTAELFEILSSISYQVPFTLADNSKSFIQDNQNIFPCKTDEDVSNAISMTNADIQYKNLSKNIANYTSNLFAAGNLTANQVFEQGIYGHNVTSIIASDNDYNRYIIFYDGSIEVYDGDKIDVRGLPIANTSYENVGGGQTNVIALIGSIVEKT